MPGGVADDAQLAGLVVQAEDERADRALLLARAPADDDRVDRADALDLVHADALAGAVAARPGAWRSRPRRPAARARASAGSSVVGVRSTGAAIIAVEPVAALGLRAARAATRRRSASRSKATNRVGVCSASMLMRDSAGWMRWPSASKSCRPCVVEEHDLAVEDVAAVGEGQLREVAAQRLAAARLQIDVRAVDEGDGAESVPFGLVHPARRPSAASWPDGRAGGAVVA